MFKCKICGKNFTELPCLYSHIEKEHSSMIPKDMCVQQYYYYMKTGKTHGNCVMCKKPTTWNMNTGKYNRFCGDPKCKDEYVKIMKGRMVAKYGKTHLLNDPNKQREMLANRSISGTYEWSDGKHESTYTGSYELDFLKTLDGFFNWDPEDISMPSPHTYTYKYNGEDKFYIPDVYIHSLELEIEIKDGGDNPNNHHKIQDVDKEKERLKDEVMCSQKAVHYVKITNKNYENLFRFLKEIKQSFEKYGDEKKIPRIFKIEDIKGVSKQPIKESTEVIEEAYMRNKKDLYVNFELFDSGKSNICLITGLSGSGKSTLSDELCKKYNATCIEMDMFEHPDMDFGPYSNELIFNKYFNNKPLLKQKLINNELNNEELSLEMTNVLSYAINYCNQHPDKKFVIEGLQIFADINPDMVKGLPIVFVNTSMINSMIRKVKRDKQRYRVSDLFEWYIADEKKFNGFKKEIIEESLRDGMDNTIYNFKKFNERKYSENDLFFSLSYDLAKNNPIELQALINRMIIGARYEDDFRYIEKLVRKSNTQTKLLLRKNPKLKYEYDYYYDWINNGGMENAIKERKRDLKLYENWNIIEENLFISKENIEVNIDKFGTSNNVLYITGLGGSGKSTIIKEYSRIYNAEALEFDAVTSALIKGLENLNTNKIHPIILEYLHTQKPNRLNGFSDPAFNTESVKFLDWFEKRVQGDNKLYILEGMQLFICFEPERFINKPMVIMGTSVSKSMFRSVSRTYKRSEGDIIKTFKFFLKTLKRIPIFVKNDKQINELIDTISECYIEEKFEPDKFLVWFDKPIQKLKGGKIKLYRGSSRIIKDKIDPMSINVGATKYSDPRWSTYFWDNKEDAISWALSDAVFDVVGGSNMEFVGHNNKGKNIVVIPDGMSEKEFKNYLCEKTEAFYVYEVEIDIKDLEIGSCPVIREYTVSKPVDIVKMYTYKLNSELCRRFIEFKTKKEYVQYVKDNQKLINGPLFRGPILNKILDKNRDMYRGIIKTDLKNGNIEIGDNLTDYKKSINHHHKNDSYNMESYITDVMSESSISIPQMNYYLQNQYEEEMRNYLNTYKKYYNLMLKEQPSAVEHINEDIRKCLIVIDDLSKKEGVENNLVQFAKDDLGEIVKASKHGKPVKVFESMVDDMININDSDDIQSITVQGDNVSISNEVIECKLVYKNPNNKKLFSLNDINSKLIIENSYVIQRDKIGSHCSVVPYYKDIDEENILEFTVTIESNDYDLDKKLTEGITITNMFKFNDFEFIREACLRLFGVYPKEINFK